MKFPGEINPVTGELDPNRLPEDTKQAIRDLSSAVAGIAGGIAGDSALNAQIAAVVGQNAVENNNVGYRMLALQREAANCKDDKCRQKVREKQEAILKSNEEITKAVASFALDFVPIVGDAKSFAEAESRVDYMLAVAGIVPVAKFVTKPLNEVKKLLKAGDLAGANKLMKKVSDELSAITSAKPVKNSTHASVAKPLLSSDDFVPLVKDIEYVYQGSAIHIRTVSSKEFNMLEEKIIKGGKPDGAYPDGTGIWYKLSDGTRVGVRESKKNGRTLDFNMPDKLPKGFRIHQR